MAVGGSRKVAYMKDGRPAAKTQMTVALSGGWQLSGGCQVAVKWRSSGGQVTVRWAENGQCRRVRSLSGQQRLGDRSRT